MVATTRTGYRVAAGEDTASFLSRWLKVWVALLAVVVLVVVAYLIVITNDLADINGNLATANRAVTGAGGHTKTLPDQVAGINGSLTGIDPALKPIPAQADAIIGALTSINDKLTATDGSLKDTSSVLVTVLGQVTGVEGTLIQADQANGPCTNGTLPPPASTGSCSPNQLGVQNIHQRVSIANGILGPARGDADNILGNLRPVNVHLVSICNSLPATVLGVLSGTPC